MKNMRKIIALLLAAALLLAGCSGAPVQTAPETTQAAVQTLPDAQPEAAELPTEDADAPPEAQETLPSLDADGEYTSKEDVALYLHLYGRLPANFITKKQAQKLGWQGGDLWKFAQGKSIGGDRFGNYEGLLPEDKDYKECDIDYRGGKRGAKRVVFSEDGFIYYTEDHYESFELLYEGDGTW